MAGADSACLLFENQSSWYRASFPEMGDVRSAKARVTTGCGD